MKNLTKVSALLLLLVMLITLTACKDEADNNSTDSLWDSALYTEDTTLGEGEKTVQVEVQAEEKSITFTINTDAQTLADALISHSLIEGEDSQYGIYIKKVNGILADYDVDGYYWSFYKTVSI